MTSSLLQRLGIALPIIQGPMTGSDTPALAAAVSAAGGLGMLGCGMRSPAAMAEAGLDALLCFKQETMYWLTGYDTFGYCFFQCLVLHADGRMVLLTRAPDLRQARHTSILEDIRVWVDGEDANPAAELRDLLAGLGLAGRLAQRQHQPSEHLRFQCRIIGSHLPADVFLGVRVDHLLGAPMGDVDFGGAGGPTFHSGAIAIALAAVEGWLGTAMPPAGTRVGPELFRPSINWAAVR